MARSVMTRSRWGWGSILEDTVHGAEWEDLLARASMLSRDELAGHTTPDIAALPCPPRRGSRQISS